MKAVLRFTPAGTVRCLHTELLDLRSLGRLAVVRATRIVFDPAGQTWEVRNAESGRRIFSHPSRDACLRWERRHLVPGPEGPEISTGPRPTLHPNKQQHPTTTNP